ncbi:hypothetical protein [Pseudohongiella sp. O18]|uniref:hypothetical protein n=1 Tax=Pseudohongiella sp. O18 TaxID=2904248 RepID=UPI001F3376C2|nr:hypothetical protein [Pseudohongiella sp. O18]
MKIALYTKRNDFFMAMLALWLTRAGHQTTEINRDKWAGQGLDADLVFVHGIRSDIIDAHAGKPVFVVESGYFQRVNTIAEKQSGHYQISYGRLNNPPAFECPSDRFDSLGITVDKAVRKKGYALLIGQVPGDSALGGIDQTDYLLSKAAEYEATGFDVKYRPHPRGGVDLPGYPALPGSLDEALDGAGIAVMYNSTTGFEALRKGIAVDCAPCAAYYELAGEKCPVIADRKAFFARSAYGQWRIDETAQAVDFILNKWLPTL